MNGKQTPNYRAEAGGQLPIQSLRINTVVGIDPDQDRSGFAVFCRLEKRLIYVSTLSFFELCNSLAAYEAGSVLVILEAGWLNKSVWHGEPAAAASWPIRARLANAAEIGRRVGINAGVGLSIQNLLIGLGHEYKLEQPTSAKLDADNFKRLTGWVGRTSQDARDAGRLAFKYQ